MNRTLLSVGVIWLTALVVLAGCSSEESGEQPASKMRPIDLMRATPQFSQVDAATYRHPIRDAENKLVMLETSKGKMMLELYRDVAPAHADSFTARVAEGFYDGLVFHRIIDRFMIQSGAFTADGQYRRVAYMLNAEFSELPHYEGALGAARGGDPNSASTQFFIDLERNDKTAYLDKKYTVFGHLITGYDVLHAIGSVPCEAQGGEMSKPIEPVHLYRAYLCDADGGAIGSSATGQ